LKHGLTFTFSPMVRVLKTLVPAPACGEGQAEAPRAQEGQDRMGEGHRVRPELRVLDTEPSMTAVQAEACLCHREWCEPGKGELQLKSAAASLVPPWVSHGGQEHREKTPALVPCLASLQVHR
jgi:hypothetical protein